MPPAPDRAFASDNAAGAHPAVIQAVVAANDGHALAYGSDRWTDEAHARFRDLFGPTSETFLVFNGTGANVMSLATMVHPAECVVCSEWAHIAVDEAGAPERALGAKLLTLPAPAAKLVPEQLEGLAHLQGVQHHAQPGVVSITQSTELGTVYTPDEVAALCDTAHRMGMLVHLDGARLSNATAALGGTVAALRSFTVDAGVDVVSFGGTKAGLLGGEAVVYLDAALAQREVRAQDGEPVAVEDALRCCAVQCPARRRPVDQGCSALEPDGAPAVRGDSSHPRRRVRSRATGQQPLPAVAGRRDRGTLRLVLLLGLGHQPPPSALDDRLGHHRRRRRSLCSRGPPPSWMNSGEKSLREHFHRASCDYLLSASISPE